MAIRIGTRGSKLALWQANHVAGLLREALPDQEFEVVVVKTTGDRILDRPLAAIGGRGLFTKELEAKLLDGSVDLCVHSCKDMPTDLPEGLELVSVPAREDARDCVVAKEPGMDLLSIPAKARVATSSRRRVAQLARLRPDVEICDIRGNVDTRVNKVLSGEFDCAIMAVAGLVRLGLDEHVSAPIPIEQMIPSPGQGALAIEARAKDTATRQLCESIACVTASAAVKAERIVLSELDGGCQAPLGAFGRAVEDGTLVIDAFVASPDGARYAKAQAHAPVSEPEVCAARVLALLRDQDADDILEESR